MLIAKCTTVIHVPLRLYQRFVDWKDERLSFFLSIEDDKEWIDSFPLFNSSHGVKHYPINQSLLFYRYRTGGYCDSTEIVRSCKIKRRADCWWNKRSFSVRMCNIVILILIRYLKKYIHKLIATDCVFVCLFVWCFFFGGGGLFCILFRVIVKLCYSYGNFTIAI